MMSNVSSEPKVTNCIFWGNTPNQIFDYDAPSSSATVTYSDVQHGRSGTGNIDAEEDRGIVWTKNAKAFTLTHRLAISQRNLSPASSIYLCTHLPPKW